MKKYKKEEKYNKKYFEIYAKKTLEYCYNESWIKCFDVNKEKPDLQSETLNIGIEVTRALPQKNGKINSMFNKYVNKNIKYSELKNKVESLGGTVYKIGKSTIMSPTQGLSDFKNHIDDLICAIKVKTIDKLPDYKIFSKNMLYVFTHEALFTQADIENAFKILNLELLEYDLKFDLYFINCIDMIFVVDMNGVILDEISISDEMLEKIKKEAINESLLEE